MKHPVGTLLLVKTTDEPVVVTGGTETEYTVRRPVQSREGIDHVEDSFHEYEVETPEESVRRKIAFNDYADKLVQGSREKASDVQVN